jgi:hypothetical protein
MIKIHLNFNFNQHLWCLILTCIVLVLKSPKIDCQYENLNFHDTMAGADHFLTTTLKSKLRLQTLNVDSLTNARSEDEHRLIGKLLANYNKNSRPPGTVEVKFALNLNQIINLLEKQQIIVINAFVDHEWVDKRLKWGNKKKKNNFK